MNYKVGVYKIENRENGKVYIGSSVEIERRFYKHKLMLDSDKHQNIHLQRAWNKYGKDKFDFLVLLNCGKDDLLLYEQRAINEFESYKSKKGYNIRKDILGQEERVYGNNHYASRKRAGCKITSEQENMIRYLQIEDGVSSKEIAKYFNITANTANAIKNRNTNYNGDDTKKLTESDVRKIKKDLKTKDLTQKQIADKFNVSISTISAIKQERNWSHITI